ncbi:hypothetical protein [Methylomagnum ishizawai]|uniref:hypothetical protein n=1 Tax=Methylomagnum ishizawai TaxID=1760988 RepID=UPI001C3306DD|nr:hypothetical protein [Methylomagnum ishizawai]BBL75435.1 hypothetical protein MishRS11D_25330 [Methylomagnum ishizawai]
MIQPDSATLLDISTLTPAQTDAALEHIYKAISDEPPGGDIWEPHHSPFLRDLIERFTRRGLMQIAGLQAELDRWLKFEPHRPGARAPAERPDMMGRWSQAELSIAKLYLETLPPRRFALDDWMLVVDYLFQRYLPHDHLVAEADWLATRATLMGRVQANMANITERQAQRLLDADAVRQARQLEATKVQRAVLDYGRARAAENIVQLTNNMRSAIRKALIGHQEAVSLGNKTDDLRGELLDQFGQWNRDWRRIAVTETAEMQNQGMVAGFPPGARLKRVEMYRGACSACRRVDGRIMKVVSPDTVPLDGETMIWAGKTNIGRSASPRKRVGGVLIAREPDELWWLASGVMHPHCRGTWLKLPDAKPSDDPQFAAYLDNLLKRSGNNKESRP